MGVITSIGDGRSSRRSLPFAGCPASLSAKAGAHTDGRAHSCTGPFRSHHGAAWAHELHILLPDSAGEGVGSLPLSVRHEDGERSDYIAPLTHSTRVVEECGDGSRPYGEDTL